MTFHNGLVLGERFEFTEREHARRPTMQQLPLAAPTAALAARYLVMS
jgi:hypothetical protein